MDSLVGTKHMSAKKLTQLRDFAEFNYNKHHIKHFLNPFFVFKEFFPKIYSIEKIKYLFGVLSKFSQTKSR